MTLYSVKNFKKKKGKKIVIEINVSTLKSFKENLQMSVINLPGPKKFIYRVD